MPIEQVTGAVPALVADLAGDGFERLAAAIMTTDTEPKCLHRQGRIGDRTFNLVAVADLDLRIFAKHLRKSEMEQIAGELGADLVELKRGDKQDEEIEV